MVSGHRGHLRVHDAGGENNIFHTLVRIQDISIGSCLPITCGTGTPLRTVSVANIDRFQLAHMAFGAILGHFGGGRWRNDTMGRNCVFEMAAPKTMSQGGGINHVADTNCAVILNGGPSSIVISRLEVFIAS